MRSAVHLNSQVGWIHAVQGSGWGEAPRWVETGRPSIPGEREQHKWLNGGVLTASLFLICATFSLERSLGRSEGGGDGQQGTPISRLGPVLGSKETSLMAAVVVGMKRKQG